MTIQIDTTSNKAVDQDSTSRAAHVILADGSGNILPASGISRNRFISATTNTLPTLAGSGTATWVSPGVRGITIDSVRVISGTLPTATISDWTVRYAIDSANDAAAALLLPQTPNTSSATSDVGQVRSFCLTPVALTGVQLILPTPIEIEVSSPILRFDLIHNIGTTLIIQFGISAVEAV